MTPTIVGIDEAGKGCIIGPLVMAGVKIDTETEELLKEFNVRDSKVVTAKERELLYDKIIELALDYVIVHIPPAEIDACENLNWLEANHNVEIINKLSPDRAIIDCPSPNIRAYKTYIYERLGRKDIDLIVAHKADTNHRVVGAASILAKVTRDREIAKIKDRIGIEFGSGYLSDEKTVTFMNQHWRTHAPLFRHSWKPYQDLILNAGQKKLTEF